MFLQNRDTAYSPHPIKYNYHVSIKPGILLDSQWIIGPLFGLDVEGNQFDALYYNSKQKGWNTGVHFNYLPLNFFRNVIPYAGFDVLYYQNIQKIYNGQGPKEFAHTKLNNVGYMAKIKIGVAFKCNPKLFLSPSLHIAYSHNSQSGYTTEKLMYSLTVNITYFLKKL